MARPTSAARSAARAVNAVLNLAGTTVSLRQTMVIPLLPAFQTTGRCVAEDTSWLITATLLTAAVATPSCPGSPTRTENG